MSVAVCALDPPQRATLARTDELSLDGILLSTCAQLVESGIEIHLLYHFQHEDEHQWRQWRKKT